MYSFLENLFLHEADSNTDLADYEFLYEENANAVIQQNNTLKTDLNTNSNTTGT